MQLNLNDPTQFTIEGVRQLLASKDDSENRQLRVPHDGIAFISDKIANIDTEELCFRLETWDRGNGYVGLSASQDEEWVKRIYTCLAKNWPTPKSSHIDFF